MKILWRDLIGYGLASIAALAGDVGMLAALVRYLHMSYVAAATLSFLFGATIAYLLSVELVFRQHSVSDRRVEFFAFVAIGVVGLLVNDAIMMLAVEVFALNFLVAKGVATGFTFCCNFVLRRQLLFVRRAEPKEVRNAFD